MPFKPKPGKTYINTREAAEIFGCSMGRIRQLALAGDLWCGHLRDRPPAKRPAVGLTLLQVSDARRPMLVLATTQQGRRPRCERETGTGC